MGIYDREYYREDRSGFFGSFSGRGAVCKWLIALNIVCFLIQLLDSTRRFTDALLLSPPDVLGGQVWRLLTYAFLHDPKSLFHIVFNMLFLWWFGSDVEDIYGPREFLAFYIVAAVLGGLAFVAFEVAQAANIVAVCIGASGAVTAVMVLFAMHYPRRKILIWFVLPIPIWAFVAFQVAQDTLIFASGSKTTTAVTVHLAGALFGFLYFKRQWRLLNLIPDIRTWQRRRTRPKLRVYREESADKTVRIRTPVSAEVDDLEAKVDAVLEKVARHGQETLTEQERQILLRASEVYRKRRT